MESIEVIINQKDLNELTRDLIKDSIKKSLVKNAEEVDRNITEYFKKALFADRSSKFELALDWSVEHVFREGLTKAMEELNFKELVAQKAKELLSDNNFIMELADAKVRSSLGLPLK